MAERRSRRGIEIPDEVAQAASLPEDLDSSVIGPYAFPSPARRRNAAWIYLGGAVVAGSGAIAGLTAGLWVAAGLLVVLAVWNLAAAWPLRIGDTEALEIANREAAFTVGHASAAVGFDGWRSRPVWNVLVFSADDPPSQRGLIRVDGVNGTVVGRYIEENPEA
jgi:hypothetical protein